MATTRRPTGTLLSIANPLAEEEEQLQRNCTYPLIKDTDMNDEMKGEVLEVCVTAFEKYPDHYQLAAQMIKESLDKKYSSGWHVVIGEALGLEVTYEEKTLLYMIDKMGDCLEEVKRIGMDTVMKLDKIMKASTAAAGVIDDVFKSFIITQKWNIEIKCYHNHCGYIV
ncbi:DNAL4 [Cordylochernes scorpioides]|uniref:Dynein light chain n=1 Tax=Cordylochernes scorpioides TaxID=51811 RepID=A0ABY6LT74_9ARAC|nr:DNAL4 [Cordylochernes scorpioides]